MKLCMVTSALLLSAVAHASPNRILCQRLGPNPAGVVVDVSLLSPERQFFSVRRAHWGYSYSMAAMTCSSPYLHLKDATILKCIGYNTVGGLTEISMRFKDGKGKAEVHSFGSGSEKNPYAEQIEGMVLPCELVHVEDL